MKKLLLIGLKDVRLAFRDRAALILMLLAPFLLTVGMGAVTGRFSGASSSGISPIPVILVNQDGGPLGKALVDLFQSKDLDELVDPTSLSDPAAAFQKVDANQAAAAIVIPAGFSDSLLPSQGGSGSEKVLTIQLYANPTTPTGAGVVKTILDEFLSQVEVGRVGGQVAVEQLVGHGLIRPQDAATVGLAFGTSQAYSAAGGSSIALNNITPTGKAVQFDVLAVLAPGMALMFLIYTVSNGGRMLLTEQAHGTLPRLLVSPTNSVQVLGGKSIGIFLTGVIQMLILIFGTSLMFGVQWGDLLAVLVLVLAAVFASVGWGMLITAVAHNPGQVSVIGSAAMLTFGILGGTFTSMDSMPAWFRIVTLISPNAWGVDGFTTLALGGGLGDILTPILGLLAMGAILFTSAVVLINRRGLREA